MRKTKNLFLGMLLLAFMSTIIAIAQEETKEEFMSVYITVTTLHRSADSDVDFSDWKKTEKEYFDKVTMKNDLII